LVELAIPTHDPETQKLLIQLFNECSAECQRAASSPVDREPAVFIDEHLFISETNDVLGDGQRNE
jgi:hypothetical protein